MLTEVPADASEVPGAAGGETRVWRGVSPDSARGLRWTCGASAVCAMGMRGTPCATARGPLVSTYVVGVGVTPPPPLLRTTAGGCPHRRPLTFYKRFLRRLVGGRPSSMPPPLVGICRAPPPPPSPSPAFVGCAALAASVAAVVGSAPTSAVTSAFAVVTVFCGRDGVEFPPLANARPRPSTQSPPLGGTRPRPRRRCPRRALLPLPQTPRRERPFRRRGWRHPWGRWLARWHRQPPRPLRRKLIPTPR